MSDSGEEQTAINSNDDESVLEQQVNLNLPTGGFLKKKASVANAKRPLVFMHARRR